MFFRAKSYIQFIFKSFTPNKIVSNFMLNILSNCFRKKTTGHKLQKFKQSKQQLNKNKSTIKVTDFGAGSQIFKSNERSVCDIAKYAGIDNKYAKLLINFATYFNPKNILEIGTSLGLGTSALAIGSSNANIISLEGCPETARVAKENFKKHNLSAEIIIGDFKETLPRVLKNKQFDLIYFDGNHQKEPTLNYFELCLTSVNEKSILIFDDIHWSKSMEEAWNQIKANPRVTTTIDTFQWGIVFFNKEPKQHYTIRV